MNGNQWYLLYWITILLDRVVLRGVVLLSGSQRAGFTNFTKFLIRILLSFYHVAQAPRRTLVGLYQHIPTNSVGESGPKLLEIAATLLFLFYCLACDVSHFECPD
jgi:hypothetical protein